MSKYTEFFLNSNSSIVNLELIQISHPYFSKVYRIVRNSTQKITVTLEDDNQYEFEYYPLKITASSQQDNLDYIIKMELGDLGEIIPLELDNVRENNAMNIKPTVKYYCFRSDDLTIPIFGPVNLEIINMVFNKNGCIFESKAPSLNSGKTGEIYTIDRFPMLKGLL